MVVTTNPSAAPVDTGQWTVAFTEGGREMADLLGGKGAGLAEMTRLGLPVPPGFTITTLACRHVLATGAEPPDLSAQVDDRLHELEASVGRSLGDPERPLLVAVRSGARFSMPGMMDTVLDVGLTDATVGGLARRSGERFAWDCYRRLVQMFGRTVMGVDGALFENALTAARHRAGAHDDRELDADTLRELVGTFRAICRDVTGHDLPQDPGQQLHQAIRAVFQSWNSPRARLYRTREGIGDDLGTAVNVVAMVFGNTGPQSGSGVCFTRNPSTGEKGVYGDYLPNAQGEDVVAGIRDAIPLAELRRLDPAAYEQLLGHLAVLEDHYRDLCDVEFTIEDGRLWVLQTRVGKRTPAAAFRIACQLVEEGRIDLDEALRRVGGEQLEALLHPQFADSIDRTLLASGLPASPGAAVGQVALDSETAVRWAAEGRSVVLVRPETSPDDLAGMVASAAVVTARGGVTSHAAVVARGMGRTCVAGASALQIDQVARTVRGLGGVTITEGELVSVDGSRGDVVVGALPVEPSAVAHALEHPNDVRDPVALAALKLLRHADALAKVAVRANADTPVEAALARTLGARGIGLCRTEHMLLGERRELVESIVLDENRHAALGELQRLHREDLTGVLRAMDGLPVVVRLLDPPLHEFLPDLTELALEVSRAESSGRGTPRMGRRLAAVRRWHEQNPMLGLRGVRLAVMLPEVLGAQVRAVAEAVLDVQAQGGRPQAELMVPLVADVAELSAVRAMVDDALESVASSRGVSVPRIPVGSMVELPRAALTAGRLATQADFFSFGTNDLTQTTWGLSRDDAEVSFLPTYRETGLVTSDPFSHLDVEGVGRLVALAAKEGRAVVPGLGLGVCGEHGGDPESVRFFCSLDVDYVSCSPWRVPVARLETGRAEALRQAGSSTDSR